MKYVSTLVMLAVIATGCYNNARNGYCYDDYDCYADEFCSINGMCQPVMGTGRGVPTQRRGVGSTANGRYGMCGDAIMPEQCGNKPYYLRDGDVVSSQDCASGFAVVTYTQPACSEDIKGNPVPAWTMFCQC